MEKLGGNANALNWFEIPATDIGRAQKFYETIFDVSMQILDMGETQMAMFPAEDSKVSGAVVKGEYNIPTSGGTLVYLNANPNLQDVLDKVEAAGGKIMAPKTIISEDWGYFGVFIDTEGNSVGVHSSK